MSRHDLPSGAWVELREPGAITERQRRAVRLALSKLSPETQRLLDAAAPPQNPDDPASLLAYAEHQRKLAEAMAGDDLERMFEVNSLVAASMIVRASFVADGARCTTDDVEDCPGRDFDELLRLAAPFLPAFLGVDFETRGEAGDRSTPT